MKYLSMLIASIVFILPLQAEVLKVQMKWPPASCTQGCAQLLQQKFQQVPGIAQVIMNQPAGQVELRWKPNYPFSYQAAYTPMQLVGLWYNDFRVKVRGTIRVNGNQVVLYSMGDNTPFILLGAVNVRPGQSAEQYNTATRAFSPNVYAHWSRQPEIIEWLLLKDPYLCRKGHPLCI